MSKTLRYNPETHHKEPERHYVARKVKRTKEEKEALYKALYTPEEMFRFKADDEQSN